MTVEGIPSNSDSVVLRVRRFAPESDPAVWYSDYSLPWREGMTLLDALRYTYRYIDRTLVFRDYQCRRELCRSCLLTVDGKTQRGCHVILSRGQKALVEPARGFRVLRDLRVDYVLEGESTQEGVAGSQP